MPVKVLQDRARPVGESTGVFTPSPNSGKDRVLLASNNDRLKLFMNQVHNEVMAANRRYAESFDDRSSLSMPPVRHFAILTSLDARLDPARYAGLAEGDAHVIRNAGGRATDDAIRSLVISYKLLSEAVAIGAPMQQAWSLPA